MKWWCSTEYQENLRIYDIHDPLFCTIWKYGYNPVSRGQKTFIYEEQEEKIVKTESKGKWEAPLEEESAQPT